MGAGPLPWVLVGAFVIVLVAGWAIAGSNRVEEEARATEFCAGLVDLLARGHYSAAGAHFRDGIAGVTAALDGLRTGPEPLEFEETVTRFPDGYFWSPPSFRAQSDSLGDGRGFRLTLEFERGRGKWHVTRYDLRRLTPAELLGR